MLKPFQHRIVYFHPHIDGVLNKKCDETNLSFESIAKMLTLSIQFKYALPALKTSIIIKRLKAFVIDYCVILVYIALLFAATLCLSNIFHLHLDNIDPITAELIGFTTLTLPVILYFTLSENGPYAGTIGKRKLGLKVISRHENKAGILQLLLRNCIKFLPWELAHFFIYRLFYFNATGGDTPAWVLTGLSVSQALAVIYVCCLFLHKKNLSIYELFSQTAVAQVTSH